MCSRHMVPMLVHSGKGHTHDYSCVIEVKHRAPSVGWKGSSQGCSLGRSMHEDLRSVVLDVHPGACTTRNELQVAGSAPAG